MGWDDAPLIEALRGLSFFADLDDLALAHVAALTSRVDLPRGHVLVEAGQEGSGLFGCSTVGCRSK